MTRKATIATLAGARPRSQARSEKTLNAILDAAEELIADKGFDAASVDAISKRAGVTIGALYGRFESKEALLAGLLERCLKEQSAVFDALTERISQEKPPFSRALEMAMEALICVYREEATLIKALVNITAVRTDIKQQLVAHNKLVSRRMHKAFAMYAKEIKHPKPSLALAFGHYAATMLVRAKLLTSEIEGELDGVRITDGLVVREAARMWEAYLRSGSH